MTLSRLPEERQNVPSSAPVDGRTGFLRILLEATGLANMDAVSVGNFSAIGWLRSLLGSESGRRRSSFCSVGRTTKTRIRQPDMALYGLRDRAIRRSRAGVYRRVHLRDSDRAACSGVFTDGLDVDDDSRLFMLKRDVTPENGDEFREMRRAGAA